MNKIVSILTVIAFVVQLVLSVLIVMLRDEIPTHWNFYGEVDSYGTPYLIMVLVLSSLFIWVICSFFKKNPQYSNLPTKVKNKEVAYELIGKLLDWIVLISIILMTYLTACVFMERLYIWVMCTIGVVFLYIIVLYANKLSKV